MIIQPVGFWRQGSVPAVPTITSVSAIGSDTLDVEFSPSPGTDWNYFYAEVYEDAGLTILNQVVQGPALSAQVGFTVGSLDSATQYWVRMKVSNNGGSTYSAWSNTGTGTTTADPLDGIPRLLAHLPGTSSQSFFWQDVAGTIPAVLAGDIIQRWDHPSGLVATNSDSSTCPILQFCGGFPYPYFTRIDSLTISPAPTLFPSKRGTLAILFFANIRQIANAPAALVATFSQSGVSWLIYTTGARQDLFYKFYDGGHHNFASDDDSGLWQRQVLIRDADTNVNLYRNSESVQALSVTDNQPDNHDIVIGGPFGGPNSYQGFMGAILLSDSQLDPIVIDSYFQSMASTELGTHVIMDGDSLTAGVVQASYPSQVAQNILTSRFDNVGVGGANTIFLINHAPQYVDANWLPEDTWQAWVLWSGTNDIFLDDVSGATVYSRVTTYCNDRKLFNSALGIVLTMLPRSDAETPADFEVQRQAFNTLLRADFPTATTNPYVFLPASIGGVTYANAMYDCAANPLIGNAGDETNLTYYNGDDVHLNATGNAIISAGVQAALTILGIP